MNSGCERKIKLRTRILDLRQRVAMKGARGVRLAGTIL